MKKTLFVVLSFLVFSTSGLAQAPEVGNPPAGFSFSYATRDSISRTPLHRSDIVAESNIVLAFYTADWSPGCTKEVCSIRDDFSGLEALDDGPGNQRDYLWSHFACAQHTISPSGC